MTRKELIKEFITQKNYAVIGYSSNHNKFGNSIYKELKTKGYNVYPVNPNFNSISEECYRKIADIPQKIDAAIIATKNTEPALNDVLKAGIKNVWLQKGTESKEALDFCRENNINVISKRCILMYIEPVTSIHKFHRKIFDFFGIS
jgi:uncharacterized protein